MRRTLGGIALSALTMISVLSAPATANAVEPEHDQTVSDDPADFTPHVLDGQVFAVAVVGNTVVVGGVFTKVRNAGAGSPNVARTNLMAFDRTTGLILQDFKPVVEGQVRSLAAGAKGSVYVGGSFAKIDGQAAFKLARLDVATGALVPGFDPGIIDSAVHEVQVADDRLFAAGYFTTVDGTPRTRLAEFDPTTGALLPGIALDVSGPVWGGFSGVTELDVTPDGSRMVITGNFRSVGGAERVQIAMLDISGPTATVTDWSTNSYNIECNNSVPVEYDLRDVGFSPDGAYFVTVATGGKPPRGTEALCDGAARWETDRTGPDQLPTWTDFTGVDSVYSVAITGSTVYVGGHFRFLNNPRGKNREGPGAVPRNAIGALDPVNGIPLTWNPGRDRGRAVWDMVATEDALYVGSDTDQIGSEFHGRIAMFPLAGGTPVPQPLPPELPVDVDLFSPAAAPDQAIRRPEFTGGAAGTDLVLPGGGWSDARAAFRIDDKLFVAHADGTLMRYTVEGDSFTHPKVVNLYELDGFAEDMTQMTSMIYDNGRLLYTLEGERDLFARGFSTQSEIVGATEERLSGRNLGLRTVMGGFLTTAGLYLADTTGTLFHLDWADGVPVRDTRVPVSGPKIDGRDWRSAAMAAW